MTVVLITFLSFGMTTVFAEEKEKPVTADKTIATNKVMVIVRAVETSFSIFHRETGVSISIENVIESELKRNKFTLLSPLSPTMVQQLEDRYARGDIKGIGNIVKDAGVDVIVFGEVLRTYVDTRRIAGGNYRFYSNDVRLKVVSSQNGVILYSGAKSKPPTAESHIEPLKDAAIELVSEFVDAVAQPLQDHTFRIRLTGVSFEQMMDFQESLNSMGGIKNVQRRDFQKDEGTFEVVYDGDMDDLYYLFKTIEGVEIKVLNIQGNEITLSVKKQIQQ